jgi:uracil-DNA glycosylase family 4
MNMATTQLGVELSLDALRNEIVACSLCPRLVCFREKIAKERKRQYANFEYWGKPLPGFGDSNARLVIVGLAPAAHGGNRTGRVFTGDSSAEFLVRHLHAAGFANQATSQNRGDGLSYKDCYVTAVVRCVPPNNKPDRTELANCSAYFAKEMSLLPNKRVILALGKIAFDSVFALYKKQIQEDSRGRRAEFEHGRRYAFSPKFPITFASYHPSPRNTNTGKLTDRMFSRLLTKIKRELESIPQPE